MSGSIMKYALSNSSVCEAFCVLIIMPLQNTLTIGQSPLKWIKEESSQLFLSSCMTKKINLLPDRRD